MSLEGIEIVECDEKMVCGLSAEFNTDDLTDYLDQEERIRKHIDGYLKGRETEVIAIRSYSDNRWQQGYLSGVLRWRKKRRSFLRLPSNKFPPVVIKADKS
jgi:hypothetical protein